MVEKTSELTGTSASSIEDAIGFGEPLAPCELLPLEGRALHDESDGVVRSRPK